MTDPQRDVVLMPSQGLYDAKHAATLSKQPRQKEYIHKIDLIMLTCVMNSFFSVAQ